MNLRLWYLGSLRCHAPSLGFLVNQSLRRYAAASRSSARRQATREVENGVASELRASEDFLKRRYATGSTRVSCGLPTTGWNTAEIRTPLKVRLAIAYIRPILMYAAPAWTGRTSDTNLLALQRIQNKYLRVALNKAPYPNTRPTLGSPCPPPRRLNHDHDQKVLR